MPVANIVGMARNGWGDADVSREFPWITPGQLDAAWRYYRENPREIEAEIRENFRADEEPPSEPTGKLPSEQWIDAIAKLGADEKKLDAAAGLLDKFGSALGDGDKVVLTLLAAFVGVLDERLGRAGGKP